MLIEKGITFKPKSKDIGDQLSDVRQYKKYKGSLKKVRLWFNILRVMQPI